MTLDVPEARVDPSLCLPPRRVPLEAHLAAILGGPLNQFGWLFLGFGMIFFWVFAWNSELRSLLTFFGETETTTGFVQRVEPTNASENDAPVYVLTYRYVTQEGTREQGTAYVTGGSWRGAETVSVEYLRRDPSVSRVPGTRRSVFGLAGAMAAIFPLVGLVIVLAGVWRGLRASYLLSRGNLAYGKLISTTSTNMTVNNRPVMAMTFEYPAADGTKHKVVSKTTRTEALEDEAQEMLLYDPSNPKSAVMVDDLPGMPDVLPEKGIVLRAPRAVWPVMILPLITIMGHGGYALYLLSR